jgi:hypothetical protein
MKGANLLLHYHNGRLELDSDAGIDKKGPDLFGLFFIVFSEIEHRREDYKKDLKKLYMGEDRSQGVCDYLICLVDTHTT